MYALANSEVADRIGDFIDNYIRLQDGSMMPRTIQMYKDAFLLMLQSGTFQSVEEIKLACLHEQAQMIPDFLFQKVYDMETQTKKC